MSKIIDCIWFTSIKTVGIIVTEDELTKERRAYVGVVDGNDPELDRLYIKEHGAPVSVMAMKQVVREMEGK
jgi:hypothetical protein